MFNMFKKTPSYNRDYIIGSICSLIDSAMDESDLESFLTGKLFISIKEKGIGWAELSVPSDDHILLLDLDKIPNDEKIILNEMIKLVIQTQGMLKMAATDVVGSTLHECLKKGSDKYAKMDYEDPRLR